MWKAFQEGIMDFSVFRINQVGYTAGLPVRVAVLTKGPVTLEDEGGKVVYRAEDIRHPWIVSVC